MPKKGHKHPPNRKPYVKPTEQERDERIEQMMEIIANAPNISKYRLRRIFTKKWKVQWNTVDRYLSRARNLLRERLNVSREAIRADAVGFYQSVISDLSQSMRDRLRAQKLLVELLGAAAPQKIEVSGQEGGPIQTETKAYIGQLGVDELKAIIGKMEQK